jgi:hypothetical protein
MRSRRSIERTRGDAEHGKCEYCLAFISVLMSSGILCRSAQRFAGVLSFGVEVVCIRQAKTQLAYL